jgi:stress response protein SCP2
MHIVNDFTNEEVVHYDLSEYYFIETALIFGELYTQ